MSKSFQYFSDIHTEFYSSNINRLNKILDKKLIDVGDILLIAGDIGHPFSNIYSYLLTKLSAKFKSKKIIITSGNHEYYSKYYTMKQIDEKINEIVSKFNNITYLQNSIYHIENTNLTVFGSTLWSDLKKDEENEIVKNMNDFSEISELNIDMYRSLHKKALNSMTGYLNEYPNRNFIMLTHHLPSYTLIDHKYELSFLNSAYASNLEMAHLPQVVAWFAGHTHTPIELGKFHINPIGYPDENLEYDLNKTVTLK
jgi:predicted MPP superfamily phosphohydrolase